MLHVTAYTGGRDNPSARFRIRQYISPLREHDIVLDECPAPLGAYPPRLHAARPLWALALLAERAAAIVGHRGSDVTILQRPMMSGYSTLERFTTSPRVLDVDDAIWTVRGGAAARQLARTCALVIAGNDYLGTYFRRVHSNVEVLPTAIDTARFVPASTPVDPGQPVLGWIGISSGLRFLLDIEEPLAAVLSRYPHARLRVVCDERPAFTRVRADRMEFLRWSPAIEATALQGMTIGLMPLREDEWCLGKCSYKMLLYMACGLPVVVTPWGMNREVLALGEVGIGARTERSWFAAIEELLHSSYDSRRLGANGRNVVERYFSLDRLAPRLASLLTRVALR